MVKKKWTCCQDQQIFLWKQTRRNTMPPCGTRAMTNIKSRLDKLWIQKTLTWPVLSYGCEAWAMKSVIRRKASTIWKENNKNLRTDRWKRLRVGAETQWRAIWIVSWTWCSLIKLKWLQRAGHTIRMDSSRTSKTVPDGKFHGRRPVGRPRLRWESDVRRNSPLLLDIRGRRRLAGVRMSGTKHWWGLGLARSTDCGIYVNICNNGYCLPSAGRPEHF